MKSKIGIGLAVSYLLITGAIILYSNFTSCGGSGLSCGLGMAFSVFPEIVFLRAPLTVPFYIIYVLVNSVILYYLGLLITKIIRTAKGQ
jgi:hypothetical protein